jgi:hypothetical protein
MKYLSAFALRFVGAWMAVEITANILVGKVDELDCAAVAFFLSLFWTLANVVEASK